MTDGDYLVPRARQVSTDLLSGLGPRWRHVVGVAQCAEEFAVGLDESECDQVIAAAWLHDVGYAPTLVKTGLHALDGAAHLVVLGFPSVVTGLVAFHTGATYEAEERGLVDALLRFDVPARHLLDTLTAADLSVGPGGDRVNPLDRFAEILARYENQDPVHRAVMRSAPDLMGAVKRTEARRLAAVVRGTSLPDVDAGATGV